MTTLNVLFLCTHNSARSILAEALLNHISTGASGTHFKGYSAGSSPRDNQQPNPLSLQVLKSAGIDTSYLRSKSWEIQKRLQLLVDLPAEKLQKTLLQHTAHELSLGNA